MGLLRIFVYQVGRVITALVAGFGLAFDYTGESVLTISSANWGMIGLIALTVFVLLTLGRELDLSLQQRPKIELQCYDNKKSPLTTFNPQTKQVISREEVIFTRVYIANNPKSSIYGATAKSVCAHIEICDKFNKLQFEMIGRWSDTEEAYTGIDRAIIEQIELPPNGRPRILDIGLKRISENEFYGYNNDTFPLRGSRDKNRCISKGEYILKIRVRGEKTDKLMIFMLNNPGKNRVVTLRGIDNQPIPHKIDS